MLRVAVLALQILGHDELGPVFADQPHDLLLGIDALLAPGAQGGFHAFDLLVAPVHEDGMGAQPRRPQAIHGLGVAAAAAVGHIYQAHVQALGAGIGNGAAQEQVFVVLVGGNHHHVQLIGHGLPLLHGVVGIAAVVDAQGPRPVFLACDGQLHLPGLRGEGNGIHIEAGGFGFLTKGLAVGVDKFHRKGFHRLAPFHGHQRGGAIGR